MTIINPTPTVKIANPPRVEGTSDADQIRRLGMLGDDVARRFYANRDTTDALSYVFHGENFDAAAQADQAVYLVAGVLGHIAGELTTGDLSTSCLDGSESKQFRKGYRAALEQVRTEMLEAISYAI